MVPTALLRQSSPARSPGSEDGSKIGSDHGDAEKAQGVAARVHFEGQVASGPTTGATLYIKKSTGMTKYLGACDGLLTLFDGPYSIKAASSVLKCDRLLLIGGGIGITSLIPWTVSHTNVKLGWSVKDSARRLVDELDGVLDGVAEKQVIIGARLDITGLLAHEIQCGWRKVGVVVSEPGGLCDDVRAAVVAAGRKQATTVFDLEVDAYTW